MIVQERPAAEGNWGGNVVYGAARLHRPASVEELQAIVHRGSRVRALGTRHSFNRLPDTAGDLVSLERLRGIGAVNTAERTVRIEGGVRYGDLGASLHAQGFALPNLASLPHLSVAGACATGTHGSGNSAAVLASAVTRLELLTAGGDLVTVSRDHMPDVFDGAVMSLGALGIVTALTLAVEPTYDVRQDVYERVPLAPVAAHFDEVMSAADSVSLFTTWQDDTFHHAWLKRRVDRPLAPAPPTWFGATRAAHDVHPVPGASATPCTPQGGVPGPWYERWPHFRMEHTPSSGAEIQSEYLLPRQHAPAALRALFAVGSRLAPLLFVSEVRTVAADSHWLSPCYGHDCAAVHFTWRLDEPAVRAVLPEIEAILAPLSARPHWGKVYVTPAHRWPGAQPRLAEFRDLMLTLDPGGMFRNAFLDTQVLGTD
ncbi:xylitol oxidase [Deinococcus metalli]|uniref:Xylitol oxidase n=1 Tax=Deinococcus metalli TaxID=1141878 RepID=A0A7W8KE25_9DEIO|nr:FAD-binding protein [Deinococcus metalli]MBB5376480.1 xylitol oxidase [Deinococcus metalli]GHF43722.1 putative xylitol oxidase [Deinococcus metalli]